MFLGHFAVGFAMKRVAPRTSLGLLIAAPQLLDLLWPWFLLAGWERVRIDPGNTAFTPLAFDSYPISHSLLTAAIWGALLGAAYLFRTRRRAIAVWLAAAVVSHWVLDWVTHGPDMPLTPWGSTRLGLGLWNSVPGTIAVEGVMFVLAVWMYARASRPRSRAATVNLWALVGVLAAIYVGNVLGPPPPDTRALAIVALCAWLFPLWAAWVDRGRLARAAD